MNAIPSKATVPGSGTTAYPWRLVVPMFIPLPPPVTRAVLLVSMNGIVVVLDFGNREGVREAKVRNC